MSGSASVSATPSNESKTENLGWAYEYDAADRVTKITDPAKRITRFDYNFFDTKEKQHLRERVKTAADGSRVGNEFDKDGRLTNMKDGSGEVSYSYDERGLLKRVERQGELAITYDRDPQGRITQMQVGDFKLEYRYDFLGRLSSINTPVGPVEYEYRAGQGEVERKYPNGIRTFSHYEPNGELREITHGYFAKPTDSSYEVLAKYSYQYRPDGLIAEIGEQSDHGQSTKAYDYDKVGRLIKADGSDGQTFTYEYDPLGNRLKAAAPNAAPKLSEFDWAGRLTRVDGAPATHDPVGNLTSLTIGGEAMNYRYTPDNQLAEVDGKVSYRYDGNGRLLSRKAGGVEIRFIPNPVSRYWQPLVMETQGGSHTLIVWEGAIPLLLIKDGKPEYLLHDHLGSVRLVADEKGQIIRRFDYEPFGGLLKSEHTTEFAPRFAGLFWDAEAKAYLTLARGYRPDLGRFMGVEPQRRVPVGSRKDLSVFTYCGGDPINLIDLDGAEPREPVNFNPQDRWWDSFWRTLAYENLGWVGGIFGKQSPLTVNTDPDVRDSVVMQIIGDAWRESHQNMGETWMLIKQWRENQESRPTQYNYMVTSQEWKTAENYAYARQWVETGKGLFTIPKGQIAASLIKNVWMPGWDAIHSIFEPLGIPPSALPISHDNKWLPVTTDTKKWWNQAINDALSNTNLLDQGRYNHQGSITINTSPILPQSSNATFNGAVFQISSSIATAQEIAKAKAEGQYVSLRSNASNSLPSTVGGVYLGGAGQLLQGIGTLEGIGKDANGNLILLGKSGGEIKLPPLRLDDVVTVFRSVYLNGEGPTVTIDPDSKNPKGPTMVIHHSEATDGTYVGWVLFHADRIMKGYNLGEDNITKLELKSKVPDYAQLLDTIYFGGDTKEESNWERFWIVPAEARRFAAIPDELTLFDVPLKVRTQPMKWESGKLVDDPNRPPSQGAKAFTEWFTGHYDGIAKEQYLSPPKESGLTEPVPVFSELRRIALMTAMAERLRDQGVPLPFWMRDYSVRPVPFEKTTPALEITHTKNSMVSHIYGGVSLSPDDSNVKTYSQPADVGKLPQQEQAAAEQTLVRSASLVPVLRQHMQGADPLQVKIFTHQGVDQQALALPGSDTLALASVRLDEADLTVPIEGGGAIQLLRRYHSFFNPKGPWGEGWALDLPRLETAKLPEARSDQGQVSYRIIYDVVTPLNSASARFSKIAEVPELGGSKLLVSDQPGEFLALADDEPLDFVTSVKNTIAGQKDEQKSMRLIGKDGSVWHFSPAGDLIATENAGLRTVYERDNGRVTGIVGLKGKYRMASIQLNYDKSGRLQSATGQREDGQDNKAATVKYEYDVSGKLVALFSDAGRISYQYQGAKVVAISFNGPGKDDAVQTVRRFEYNAQGQLLSELDAKGAKTEYRIASDATGHNTLTTVPPGKDMKGDSIQYDDAYRPLQAYYADGSTALWKYGKDGMTMELTDADGRKVRLAESANQRQRTLELNPQRKLVGEYDSAGRLTQLSDNGLPLLHQEWESDGRLQLAASGSTAIHPEYDADGLVSRIVLAPPGELGNGAPWYETKLNPVGKPLEITDYSGLQMRFGYEKTGELQGMTIQRDDKDYGFTLKRDPSGRVQALDSSWSKQSFGYDGQGLLNRAEIVRDNAHSIAEWNAGRLVKVSQFDGGETEFSYNDKGGIHQIIAPNGLTIDYLYDTNDRLQEVALVGFMGLSLAYDDKGRVKSWDYHPGRK